MKGRGGGLSGSRSGLRIRLKASAYQLDSRVTRRIERAAHDRVHGRQRASGIGIAGVAREREGLAAAAAEIDRLAGAGGAGLPHPIRAAERRERRRALPNVVQRAVAYAPEREARDGLGGVAGENLAARRDVERAPPPAVDAGLRIAGEVIRGDIVDDERSLQ